MLKNMIKKIPGTRWVANQLGLVPKEVADHRRQFLLDMMPKKSVAAEIGVFVGKFSKQILDSVSPKELHLIDPWQHQTSNTYANAWYGGRAKRGQKEMDEHYATVLRKFKRNIRVGQVKVHRGFSTDVLEQFPDLFFDWVYIDGNHLYECVKKDLEMCLCKVKVGGYITGDDYTEGRWWQGGVKRAVDELTASQAVRLIELRDNQFIFVKNGEVSQHPD